MTDQQINELAENLDCGECCYIHKTTKTILAIPEFAFEPGSDSEEIWEDLIKEIEEILITMLRLRRWTPMNHSE